jgi:hypothetical protein
MPHATRARKLDARRLAADTGLKYQEAVELLTDFPEKDQAEVLAVLEGGHATTLRGAEKVLAAMPAEQRLLCEKCGWVMGQICPECSPGCGCPTGCTGWRHQDYGYDDDGGQYDDDLDVCGDCGGGGEYDAPCHCDVPAGVCEDCGHSDRDNGCVYHCDCPSC